jgi:hypothetical protein
MTKYILLLLVQFALLAGEPNKPNKPETTQEKSDKRKLDVIHSESGWRIFVDKMPYLKNGEPVTAPATIEVQSGLREIRMCKAGMDDLVYMVDASKVSVLDVTLKLDGNKRIFILVDERGSKLIGGKGGKPFREVDKDKKILVGLNFTVDDKVIKSVQPIFRNPDGKLTHGVSHGKDNGRKIEVLAKDGYAVGGLNVWAGDKVDGVRVVFMRVVDGKLDVKDSYESDVVGVEGGLVSRLHSDGRFIIGVNGREGEYLDALGVVWK